MSKNNETIEALERVVKAGDECYFAFNHLSVITKVEFRFYATDLYDALKLCKAWLTKLKEEGK